MTPLIRLIDDDPTVLDSQSFVLEVAGFHTVAYDSAQSFLTTGDMTSPGAILCDVRMPQMTGLELFHELRIKHISLPFIFLTAHGDIEMAVAALHDGAFDFLVKPADPEKLIAVIGRAVQRDTENRARKAEFAETAALVATLTPAELKVAELVAKGFSVKEIADVLSVSEQAVKMHRSSLFKKFGVTNPVEAAQILRDYNEGLRQGAAL